MANTKISIYKSGTVLYEEGDYCDTLIAVIEGNIKNSSGKEILAEKGQMFGTNYLSAAN